MFHTSGNVCLYIRNGYLVNKQSNNEPIPVIYGSRLVGGTIVFIEVTGDSNEYLHLVIVLCEGPISAINTVYLNDVASTDAKYTGYVDIYKHLGADDRPLIPTPCPLLQVDKNHRLGAAYIYACLKRIRRFRRLNHRPMWTGAPFDRAMPRQVQPQSAALYP